MLPRNFINFFYKNFIKFLINFLGIRNLTRNFYPFIATNFLKNICVCVCLTYFKLIVKYFYLHSYDYI